MTRPVSLRESPSFQVWKRSLTEDTDKSPVLMAQTLPGLLEVRAGLLKGRGFVSPVSDYTTDPLIRTPFCIADLPKAFPLSVL